MMLRLMLPKRFIRRRTPSAFRRRAMAILGIFLSLFVHASFGRGPSNPATALRSVLATLPHSQTAVGVCVVDLSTGSIVFAHHPDAPLVPASSMKVFAMAVALEELGADFSFETRFATDGESLFVIGDGDPGFGDERLCRQREETVTDGLGRWGDDLIRVGITQVTGDLVIDETVFDDEGTHPTWERSDLDNWYAAPVGGLNFNDNCVDITIWPAGATDTPVLWSVQPANGLVRVVNKCRSGGRGTPILHHPHDSFEYRISGRCGKRWRFGSVSFPDPGLLFADALRTVLLSKGITIEGAIQRRRVRLPDGTVPTSLTLISTHVGPISDILMRAGKNSQNLFAECLFKRAGYAWAKRRGILDPRGGWKLGQHAVVDMIARVGTDPLGFRVADGSGLSRENRCSAKQMAEMLAWAHRQPWGRPFQDSLAVAGVDGSLRRRLQSVRRLEGSNDRSEDLPGEVYAKTGTMRGVSALAGYVDPKSTDDTTGDARPSGNGPRYAFAILFNGYPGPSTPYKQLQDRFCRILAGSTLQTATGR